ncbi:MAG: Arc family DNA-binding protein [Cetobacterium sp.]
MKKENKDITPITIRFPTELIKRIRIEAVEDNRSLNNMIIELLKKGLKKGE